MTKLSPSIINELQSTITAMAIPGKGLLAADESTGTISKRFDALNIPSTEETRREYRELLLATPQIEKYISGVILFEETLFQKTSQGISFSQLLVQKGIVPGIKVDKGLTPLFGSLTENYTQGLDGLSDRLKEYKKQGARFAKWRAVFSISKETPSAFLIQSNAIDLARYAALCQENGLVPIVEPEVLIDGEHTLQRCLDVSFEVLHSVFHQLHLHKVVLEFVILKPSMVTPGKNSVEKVSPEAVAQATLSLLRRTVPPAVPSINFLSGGQTPEQATQNLNAMHRIMPTLPWNLSFSYARALQEPAMKAWLGKAENKAIAEQAFLKRAKLNSLASLGQYENKLENA